VIDAAARQTASPTVKEFPMIRSSSQILQGSCVCGWKVEGLMEDDGWIYVHERLHTNEFCFKKSLGGEISPTPALLIIISPTNLCAQHKSQLIFILALDPISSF
jgi:hypothetical protein